MPQRWFFHVEDEGQAIVMVARAEGPDDTIGDAHARFEPGDDIVSPPGLTYALLREAGGGVLEIADDYASFRIVPDRRSDSPERSAP